MAYIPKNKIQQNLQTNGDEYKTVYNFKSNVDTFYNGFYYKLANGKTFTGKFPGDGKNEEIIKVPSYIDGKEFQNSTSQIISFIPPLFPTLEDYKFGSFIRYFSKKRNEYIFEELTKTQYDTLNNVSNNNYYTYKPFYIKWMLTGDIQTVTDFNFYSIKSTEETEKVYGLNEFLKMDYIKYYKPTV